MRIAIPLPYLIVGALITVLCLTLWRVGWERVHSRRGWLLHQGAWLPFAAMLFFLAPWAFLSVYLKWFFLAAYIGSLARSAWVSRHLPWKAKLHYWHLARRLAVMAGGLFVVAYILIGFRYEGQPLRMQFPMRQGTYFVMQGGGSVVHNPFHGGFSWQHYGYAIDLGKLNGFGARGKSVFSRNNDDYAIYGDTVYAPIDAKVLYALDTIPDNVPGNLGVNPVHGNYLIMQHGPYRIYLVHFSTKKVFVRKGQKVKAGQPLGLQGNSGFSVEPHAHIHVWKDCGPELFSEGTSVPILFEGDNFLTLNELISR